MSDNYANSTTSYTCAAAVKMGRFVKLSSGEITPATAAADADDVIGVAMQDGAAGDVIAVCVDGYCDVECASASITKLGKITIDAAGRANVQAAAGSEVTHTVGISQEAGAAMDSNSNGALIRVKLLLQPRQALLNT